MELVEVKNTEVFCDSGMVARKFDMKHNQVSRVITQLIIDIGKLRGISNTPEVFQETREYRGTKYTAYLMDRDFFSLLVMRFKGKKAIKWQMKFIAAFNAMEERISQFDKNAKDPIWLQSRAMGKIARREETDVIKKFVEYATSQGSKSAKFYYKHLTNTSYKAVGLMKQKKPKLRDVMDIYEQATLLLAEKRIRNALERYMKLGRNYKDIYNSVRDDILEFGPGLGIDYNPDK